MLLLQTSHLSKHLWQIHPCSGLWYHCARKKVRLMMIPLEMSPTMARLSTRYTSLARHEYQHCICKLMILMILNDIEWYWIFTPILIDDITLNIKLMILNDIDVNVMWMSSRALVGSRSQISHLTRTMDGWIRSGMTCLMRSRLQRPAGSSLSWWNNLKTIVNITIIVMTITMIIYYYLYKSRCGIVAYLDLFLER